MQVLCNVVKDCGTVYSPVDKCSPSKLSKCKKWHGTQNTASALSYCFWCPAFCYISVNFEDEQCTATNIVTANITSYPTLHQPHMHTQYEWHTTIFLSQNVDAKKNGNLEKPPIKIDLGSAVNCTLQLTKHTSTVSPQHEFQTRVITSPCDRLQATATTSPPAWLSHS